MTIPVTQRIDCYWVIPDRFLAGQYPALLHRPDAAERLDALLACGIDIFINLAEPDEANDYGPLLTERAALCRAEIRCFSFPIVDLGLPNPNDMMTILDAIDNALAEEHRVYLHCIGGIGRTGTVVGCYLVRHGHTGEEALQQIRGFWRSEPSRRYIPMSPETPAQVQYVLNWREPWHTTNS